MEVLVSDDFTVIAVVVSSAPRLSIATTPTIGSLPERFSWQPFHSRHAVPIAPPHACVSGSLGNYFHTHGAHEYVRNYCYAPLSSSMQPPPPPHHVCSSSGQTDYRPILSMSHSHGQFWESRAPPVSQTVTRCHHPATSCCSQPSLISQSLCGAQYSKLPNTADSRKVDPGHYDETTPLLSNCPYVSLSFLLFTMLYNYILFL